MIISIKNTLFGLSMLSVLSCNPKPDSSDSLVEIRKTIEIETDYGPMVIELYNETPLHRDNFIKLAGEGAFDSLLFHRVIEEFMIQGGDPDSRNAKPGDTLGNGGLPYKVDAEFNPDLFHKKGVIAAARDNNPDRASSSMQFYIVQGKIFNDSLLAIAETRINGWLAQHFFKKDPANQWLLDSIQMAMDNEDLDLYTLYNDSLLNMAKSYDNFKRYSIPDDHRVIYKTIGGTPHLDQNYTVFGEVVKGIDAVDSIAIVETGPFDRPVSDVRIKKVRVLE